MKLSEIKKKLPIISIGSFLVITNFGSDILQIISNIAEIFEGIEYLEIIATTIEQLVIFLKNNDDVTVALVSLLLFSALFISKRKQYKRHIHFLQLQLNEAATDFSSGFRETTSAGYKANKAIRDKEIECIEKIESIQLRGNHFFESQCIDFYDQIRFVDKHAYLTYSTNMIASIKRLVDTILVNRFGHSFEVRALVKIIDTPQDPQPEHIKKYDYKIVETLCDEETKRQLMDGCFEDTNGHKVSESTALNHAVFDQGKHFIHSDTSSIDGYKSGPSVLEDSYNAKIVVPVYKDATKFNDDFQLYAFIVVLVKNEEKKSIFNTEHIQSEPILSMLRSKAAAFSSWRQNSIESQNRVIKCINERLQSYEQLNGSSPYDRRL